MPKIVLCKPVQVTDGWKVEYVKDGNREGFVSQTVDDCLNAVAEAVPDLAVVWQQIGKPTEFSNDIEYNLTFQATVR